LGQKKKKLEAKLKQQTEEYERAVEERKELQHQREREKFAHEEKNADAKRNRRTLQRQLDRKGTSMEENERKKLEAEIESLAKIEEETKDAIVYDELPPLEEPPSSLGEVTIDENDVEIDVSSIVLSDDELNDPSLDKVDTGDFYVGDSSSDETGSVSSPSPVSKPVKAVSAPKAVKTSPAVKKQPAKKQPIKKTVPKKTPETQKPKEASPEKQKPKEVSSSPTISASGDEREIRRQLRADRRLKILEENKRPQSILALVAGKKAL